MQKIQKVACKAGQTFRKSPVVLNILQKEVGDRRGGKAFSLSEARVLHLAPFPLSSSPASCSLSVQRGFLPVFLASQVSVLSISACTPPLGASILFSYLSRGPPRHVASHRDAKLAGGIHRGSVGRLKLNFKPHH